jgi:hypothetical protein
MLNSSPGPSVPGSIEEEDKIRKDNVRRDIANRLRKACSHLSEKEFAALVERMTRVQLGY